MCSSVAVDVSLRRRRFLLSDYKYNVQILYGTSNRIV